MTSGGLVSDKKRQVRDLLVEKRDGTSAEYMALASRKVAARVLATGEFKDAKNIGAYYSLAGEVSTPMLLEAILECGKSLHLPRVTSASEMGFYKVSSLSDLTRGALYRDVLEPRLGAKKASKIDMLLVPAVAMDYNGNRLGYGRGYYDRYLARLGKDTVGTGGNVDSGHAISGISDPAPHIMQNDASEDLYAYHTCTNPRAGTNNALSDELISAPATIMALVLEKQLVRRLPVEAHDVRMDMTITEKRTIRH